ncbi:MAG: beta-phosphoglucomutase [Kiritimatiellae bacterium]|nr:beta-phosphoglucomutase [Kiritimatiellia bacterium]
MDQRGVIFDLDGVIVDTAKYHYRGWKRLADELGVPFDEVKNEKLKGVSRRESLVAMLGYTPPEEQARAWCDRKNGYYVEYISRIERDELLPGALDLIAAIRASQDWKQALASSSKNSRLILERLDIGKYFDAVVDGNDIVETKPNPEIFIKAAARLGLPSDRVVVVEDAESGVRAAKAAGMLAIGLGRPEVLGEADLVVSDLAHVTLEGIAELFEYDDGAGVTAPSSAGIWRAGFHPGR